MNLSAHNLIKVYNGRKVVNDVSLEVSQDEIVGLLGPNGAGKTTTFYMTVGMISPDAGKITCNDTDITCRPMCDRARLGIGYLPQESSVFRDISVEENIMAPLEFTDLTKQQRYERVDQLLQEFHITHIRKNKGKVLSGGERRRVEIARLLAINPKIVLLDEPFAGVDPIAVHDIQSLILDLKKKGIGVLITDHNVDETLSITDRAYLMYSGQLLKTGTPEELVNDEEVRRVYLGENFVLKDRF
ncbi:MAG: LPS export ABC transporter ATP-binding protein [Cytophagales bacterium]|nr:LPS export ABC transporter ATP-binding protein [Cytophagales bacterium]